MKSTEKWFGELLDSCKDDFEFRLETIIFELTEQISKKLKGSNMSQKQLAEQLGIKPAAVSKILNGKPNFTLRTLLALADALKVNLAIELKNKVSAPAEVRYPTTASDVNIDVTGRVAAQDLTGIPPAWFINATSASNT
jgi:transcriptional regulator with XRE-family HTH domain